jgi:hypothetical protein
MSTVGGGVGVFASTSGIADRIGSWARDAEPAPYDAFVVPRDDNDLLGRLARASDVVRDADWRLHDVSTVPLPCFPSDTIRTSSDDRRDVGPR